MKKFTLFAFLCALIISVAGLCACSCGGGKYDISTDESKSYTLEVGDEVDFTQYFIVKDNNGNQIVVTENMLDLTQVDTSAVGTFTVTLKIGSSVGKATFIVVPQGTTSADEDYRITVDTSKPTTVTVGSSVDYKQYFKVTDKNGNQITITDNMLDLSKADTSKAGKFTVTLKIGNATKSLTFTVVSSSTPDPDPQPEADLSKVFAKYTDISTWNFATTLSVSGEYNYEDYFEYLGNDVLYRYEGSYGETYTDYLVYDAATEKLYYYFDNDGSYIKYEQDTDEFNENFSYMTVLFLEELSNFTFTKTSDGYSATSPNETGNSVIGEYEDSTWTSFKVFIANDSISKIIAKTSDSYTFSFTFSKYGTVNFTIPNATEGGTTTPTEPTGTMEKQVYDAASFDTSNLQEKMLANDGAIGLPSTGNINALVIPVQFKGDTITQSQLNKLNTAFNGTSEETGWESVKTYYQKASYGNLNLSFDIQSVYATEKNSSYYESYRENYTEGGETFTRTGEEIILTEVLAYYENKIDLTKYDTNGDGAIDAVYLIYSAPVDYTNADFYWAYVTWYYGDTKYDGKDAYFYLFAGFDFMDEDLDKMSGLKVNAATYIHETGHLLGLDDYYDYEESKGSNEGLGGADMMDYTVGDQNVYSKTMLGWIAPTIVNETTTITIQSSQAKGDAIIIPLNFNNSYFCEYLMIDLYSAQGLNAMHSSVDNTLLYDGANYGVRIYHVSSSANNPYNDEYGSFTDNNNSVSDNALIKLVEADGEKKFAGTGGYASQSDLWQAGDSLLSVFPNYMRNDAKKVNFDITINSVSATEASITITFAE